MKPIRTFLSFCLLTISLGAFAQTSPVPANYSLKNKEDYAKYETDVVNTINWLEKVPWSDQSNEKKAANAFVMAWMEGSPTVSIEIGEGILTKVFDKNKALLFSYMMGYTKYAIENHDDKNAYSEAKARAAGLTAIIAKYNAEPGHTKDKNVDMLAKLDSEDKLEAWAMTDLFKK